MAPGDAAAAIAAHAAPAWNATTRDAAAIRDAADHATAAVRNGAAAGRTRAAPGRHGGAPSSCTDPDPGPSSSGSCTTCAPVLRGCDCGRTGICAYRR